MPSKKFILLCGNCSWKKVCGIDDTGLHELKNDSMSSRKFRCPGCGMAIAPRKFPDPQAEVERSANEARIASENEAFIADHSDFQRRFLEETSKDE